MREQCPECGKRHGRWPQACLASSRNMAGYEALGGKTGVCAVNWLAMREYLQRNWPEEYEARGI